MVKLQGAENQIIIDYQVYEKRPSLAGGRRGFVLTGVEAGVAGNQTSHPPQLRFVCVDQRICGAYSSTAEHPILRRKVTNAPFHLSRRLESRGDEPPGGGDLKRNARNEHDEPRPFLIGQWRDVPAADYIEIRRVDNVRG